MFRRFLFSRIWSSGGSAQDHAVLVLLLNLVVFFMSTDYAGQLEIFLYHNCTSLEGASRGGEPLNILTWFIVAAGFRNSDDIPCDSWKSGSFSKPNPEKWCDEVTKSSHLYQVPGKLWKYLKKKFRNLAASHRIWNVIFCDENVTSHLFVTVPHSNPGPGSGKFSARNDLEARGERGRKKERRKEAGKRARETGWDGHRVPSRARCNPSLFPSHAAELSRLFPHVPSPHDPPWASLLFESWNRQWNVSGCSNAQCILP